MTVQELIDKLIGVDDKDIEICFIGLGGQVEIEKIVETDCDTWEGKRVITIC